MSGSSSILSRLAESSRTPTGKLILVAAASTALTASSILAAQSLRRATRRRRLKSEIEHRLDEDDEEGDAPEEMMDFTRPVGSRRSSLASASKSAAARGGTGRRGQKKKGTSEVIIREALARNYVFFGDEQMDRIRDKFVVVVGLGGVGSAAAVMLVRSGVRKIRVIDFDQVSLSSLNRHSTATLAQVGTPKVSSCAEYFAQIAPWVEVDARIELFEKDKAPELLEGNPDYVIDCIDNIDSKVSSKTFPTRLIDPGSLWRSLGVDLLAYCSKNGLPVFSALGAAAKSDPSRIQVSDISTTFEDPLARQVRRRLRMEGVLSGVPVVYSTEKPRPDLGLLPLPEDEFQKGKVDELHAMSNFRVRILPVLGPLPAMVRLYDLLLGRKADAHSFSRLQFGNAAATYVLLDLAGFKQETLPVKNRHKTAATLHRQLAAVEQKLTGDTRLPFSEDDLLYLFEEIHRAKSVAPPHVFPARPTVLRWKKDRGLAWDNLVVFERDEGTRHEEHCLVGNEDPEEYWGPEVTALVERRAAEERRLRGYRM
ncbi:SPOSA6832_03325, partial [Sporobolomyces salmonicolor]